MQSAKLLKVLLSATLLIAILLCVNGCASSRDFKPPVKSFQSTTIALERANGHKLVVKKELGNRKAWEIALDLKRIDNAMASVTNTAVFSEELRAFLAELRDESISELETGQFIALHTSGETANPHLGRSRSFLEVMEKLLRGGPVVKSNVRTSVKVEGDKNAALHYCTYKSYKSGSPEWQSYTLGMTLEIRTYFFQVITPAFPYVEMVIIWDDPTEVTLRPEKL